MKNLFDKITDKENLFYAFDIALANLKTKKRKYQENKKEKIVEYLYENMRNLTWRMKYSNPFYLQEKKKVREIICCSFRDRVAQQAILNICEPIFAKCMIADSYQAQVGKGIHKASMKLRNWIKQFRKNGNVYFLHLDIRKYYANIDSDVMIKVLSNKIQCKQTLELFKILLAGDDEGKGVGVTLGNNVSQWLGNMYLYDLDHYFTTFKDAKYMRYADDMIFLNNDKKQLHKILNVAKLKLKHKKLSLSMKHIGQITQNNCLDTLGYRHYIDKMLVRNDIKHSLSKSIAKNNQQSIASLLGHCMWANTKKIVYNIMKNNGAYNGKTA